MRIAAILPTGAVGLLLLAVAGRATAQSHERFAAMEQPSDEEFVPRYYAGSPPVRLFPRQGNGLCRSSNSHQCLDTGNPNSCCDNTQYCIITPDWRPWCCAIGSNCESLCPATEFQCNRTVTAAGVVSTVQTCCPRACPSTSSYLCPSSLGGACCPYGVDCLAGGSCAPAPSTSTAPPLVTAVDPGCTTGQRGCTDLGGGCCGTASVCTFHSDSAVCAPGNPANTNDQLEPQPPGGLSSGAKAGIGVGVAVGVSALIGVVAWICIAKRRQQRQRERASGGGGSGGGGGGAADGPAMSEVTNSSRPRPLRGVARDYVGPTAVAGPYTDMEHGTMTPQRGVPMDPHGPDDIAAPVEIDSHVKSQFVEDIRDRRDGDDTPPSTDGQIYELYGSELPTPSPGLPSPVTTVPLASPSSPTAPSALSPTSPKP